jgi:hypothetical protein
MPKRECFVHIMMGGSPDYCFSLANKWPECPDDECEGLLPEEADK